jgi:coenzyme F420-reducing hydrogenase delta subunit
VAGEPEMSAELEFKPRLLGIVCNWCCYGGADLCGVSRFQYPPFIRLIRVMCSGRVDLAHIFRAFSNGMDAVFVGGCHINDCHYVTEGNYDALGMVKLCKKLLGHIGVNPDRLRLEWVSAGEGIRFANIMNEYGTQVQKLGPLGRSEGLAKDELAFRLQAVARLVPYLRLVQTERLRVSPRTEAEYVRFFGSAEFDRLFDELVAEKLAVSRITLLLGQGPLSSGGIAERLGLSPSEVSKHLKSSSKQGLVKYDVDRRCYCLA